MSDPITLNIRKTGAFKLLADRIQCDSGMIVKRYGHTLYIEAASRNNNNSAENGVLAQQREEEEEGEDVCSDQRYPRTRETSESQCQEYYYPLTGDMLIRSISLLGSTSLTVDDPAKLNKYELTIKLGDSSRCILSPQFGVTTLTVAASKVSRLDGRQCTAKEVEILSIDAARVIGIKVGQTAVLEANDSSRISISKWTTTCKVDVLCDDLACIDVVPA